tara:strand:+ start:4481 stop:4762 length:282 start_codon:yes stop_codon:yes gene_type:complete
MKDALKELLREEPKSIGCMFINGKAIVYIEYNALEWSYALHFKGEDLIEVEMIEKYDGVNVLFGQSIGTDRDILNEICFEINPSIIEYKKELY